MKNEIMDLENILEKANVKEQITYHNNLKVFELILNNKKIYFPNNWSIFKKIKVDLSSKSTSFYRIGPDSNVDNLYEIFGGPKGLVSHKGQIFFLSLEDNKISFELETIFEMISLHEATQVSGKAA